jgi:acyl-CoA thioester hydrolase
MPHRSEFLVPEEAYSFQFRVEDADIDELGHANNVVWIRWVNQAAIAHTTHAGLGAELYQRLGVLWVVRRHDIEYLVPALAGAALEAMTWVDGVRGATSLRRTVIRAVADQRVHARAATTWALIHADSGKPRRIPEEMMTRYGYVRCP